MIKGPGIPGTVLDQNWWPELDGVAFLRRRYKMNFESAAV